jgi:glutathione S-transferase
MLKLYSYPGLFGLADNNPYGLKVYAFLRLNRIAFAHEHILDASRAPRGQLPYIDDAGVLVGDSDAIIAYLTDRDRLAIDAALTPAQRDTHLLVRRALDDLYWVMSYSRWKDDRFWPLFRDALLRTHAELAEADLRAARDYNFLRYRYQGIGRFEPSEAYARGLADLRTLAHLLPASGYMFGDAPTSIDAALYGFIANILFYEIPTPLRDLVLSQPHLAAHCRNLHERIEPASQGE